MSEPAPSQPEVASNSEPQKPQGKGKSGKDHSNNNNNKEKKNKESAPPKSKAHSFPPLGPLPDFIDVRVKIWDEYKKKHEEAVKSMFIIHVCYYFK